MGEEPEATGMTGQEGACHRRVMAGLWALLAVRLPSVESWGTESLNNSAFVTDGTDMRVYAWLMRPSITGQKKVVFIFVCKGICGYPAVGPPPCALWWFGSREWPLLQSNWLRYWLFKRVSPICLNDDYTANAILHTYHLSFTTP